MKNQLKNPLFWCVLSFGGGMGIGAWGLAKQDATNFHGSGALIGIGIAMIIIGFIGMLTFGNKKL